METIQTTIPAPAIDAQGAAPQTTQAKPEKAPRARIVKPGTIARAQGEKAPKTSDKPQGKAKQGKGKETQAPAIRFYVQDFARPRAGSALAAHTAAFLQLSGIESGKAYPKASAVRVVGSTAIKYHLANGNFEATSDGIKMTEKGKAFFAARHSSHPIEPELLAAFIKVMTTGELDERANVKAEISRAKL